MELKQIIANNISSLRRDAGMTQAELAEKLNYTDKAVSKWERGESCPDITVLKDIAELFGVTLDSLVKEEGAEQAVSRREVKAPKYNRHAISYIAEGGGWIIAISAFIITTLIIGKMSFQWLYFIYTLPIALIVKLIFNSVWFNPRNNYLIISALMWSILVAIHITFLYFKIDVSLIYLLGVAGQVVIILCSFIGKPKIK